MDRFTCMRNPLRCVSATKREQGNWEYTATKYALRGFMRTVRRSSWEQGIRINYVAPCWIKSAIRSADYEKWLIDHGIEFGEQEDCGRCMLRIACDTSINGKCNITIVSAALAKSIGHSLMIVPRSVAAEGFLDVDKDDYVEEGYFKKTQETQLRIIEDKWLDDYKVRIYKSS